MSSRAKSNHRRGYRVRNAIISAVASQSAYVHDHRVGSAALDDPRFTDRPGNPLTGNAVRKLFERLKTRSGIHDLCAHMLRHP